MVVLVKEVVTAEDLEEEVLVVFTVCDQDDDVEVVCSGEKVLAGAAAEVKVEGLRVPERLVVFVFEVLDLVFVKVLVDVLLAAE